MDEPRIEESPRWVRAFKDGELVVDSRRAHLVWQTRPPIPLYGFPPEDVRLDRVDIAREVGELVVPEPDQMDHWLEEDDVVFGHPRDPYHRVDARRSSRHVVVRFAGEVVAESHRPTLVFETGLPVRVYLPRADVRLDLLERVDHTTVCPYKGVASYWTLRVGDSSQDGAVWSYERPMPDNPLIGGLIAFLQEQLEVEVDGTSP